MMIEKWKRFYDYYEVSNIGRLRSIDRLIERKSLVYNKPFKRFYKGKILKLYKDKNGYYQTVLYNKLGEPKVFFIHRLVIEHFGKSKPYNGSIVYFKDGNRDNITVSNLAWVHRVKISQKY